MKVKIKKLNPSARIPAKSHEDDFCYDVWAVSEEEVAPNVWKYGLGIAFQIERAKERMNAEFISRDGPFYDMYDLFYDMYDFRNSFVNLSIDIRPRSSVWKTGMVLSNCEGTVDEGYTGEVSAVFYHVVPSLPRYKVGDKIAQIKIGATLPIEYEEVSELDETERGEGGYGSTGKR